MDFRFDEDQEELRSTARAFLAEHSGPEAVRRAMASELGYDPALWKQLGGGLGWTAVHIPEAWGGLGLGHVELVALLETMGGALLCAPYFSSVCLAANAILCAGTEPQKAEHLPGIAAGETRATLALCEASGRWDAEGIEATARPDGAEWVLSGRKAFVLDGHCADLFVVAARQEGTRGERGVGLFVVPGDARGLTRRRLPTMDATRRLAQVDLAGVRVPASARLGAEGETWPALEKALQLASVACAAEQVGGAQRCLDLAVEYAGQRVQFGRPIGSFQALKHKCADMMVAVESARSAVYYAACIASEGSDELAACSSIAKATASEAFFRCAADCIQIHGGVGFTWEYDVHLYFKRARASESFLGDPAWHREQVARLIGL